MSNLDQIAPFLDKLQFLENVNDWVGKFGQLDYMEPFVKVLLDFSTFTLDYFSHFAPTLTELKVRGIATSDRQNMSIVLSRLHQEWLRLRRVGQQWELKDNEFKSALREALNAAIKFYSQYNGIYSDLATPIVYFEKSYEISRAIYSLSPIISIPFDDFVPSIGATYWSALAHELGHYFFWNAALPADIQQAHRTLRDELVKRLAQADDFTTFFQRANLISVWSSWLEETVADICGALLGGEIFVRTAFERMKNRVFTEEDLTADDGQHPAPIIRYEIGLAVLESVAPGSFTGLRETLNSDAATLIKQDAVLQNTNETILIADLAALIPEIVDLLLNKAAVWRHKDGRNVALHELFDLTSLYQSATQAKAQSAAPGKSQPDRQEVLDQFVQLVETHRQSDSHDDAFGHLLDGFKQQFAEVEQETEREQKIINALLDLDLSEEEDAKWCCTKWKPC